MTQAAEVVVRRRIVVAAPIERAFTVFTERFGDFKPPEHNLLGAPIAERRDTAEGVRVRARLPRREIVKFARFLVAGETDAEVSAR